MFSSQDREYMRLAVELAEKGRGKTSPNPMVGAVVVKGNKIIGKGYHLRAGGKHAEVLALEKAKNLKGVKLYVTLEPCCHEDKRTPPCTDYLIERGIKHVVAAIKDPNPKVNGRGIRALRKAGIKVEVGLLKKEAEILNEVFIKNINASLPFVVLKLAFSLDGKIALSSGDSKWITNEFSRKYVHEMRSNSDAVMTTSSTVLKDDPHLGVRYVRGKDPLRIILDRGLKIPLSAKVFRDGNVMVVTSEKSLRKKIKELEKLDVSVLIHSGSLKMLFKKLYKQEVTSILIEAGGTFAGSLIKENIVDKCVFFYAPKIIGADGISGIGIQGLKRMSVVPTLKNLTIKNCNGDILVEAYTK